MVTHDIDEALRLADHVALMNAGRLEQFGTPDELVLSPATPFVERFFGEDARIRRLSGRTVRDLMHDRTPLDGPDVSADASARAALALMLRAGRDTLAVTDAGRVVGRIRLADLGQT